MDKRLSAMEEYIEKRVEERLEEEIDHALTLLEKNLPADEFRRVLEVMAGESGEEERGVSG
jgi:hypothetical protein